MDQPIEDADDGALRGKCPFCAADLPADADVCPECGHSAGQGLLARPRRPIWVRVLAIFFLLMLLIGLVAWLVSRL